MNNQLTLRVQVSFQGQVHNLQAQLDLDKQLRAYGGLPDLHDWVARTNQIDAYSYLYEAIQMEPVEIIEVSGRVAEFIDDGQFLADAFIEDWRVQNALPGLVHIAKQHLQTELETNPQLKQALIDAYKLGLEHGRLIPREED